MQITANDGFIDRFLRTDNARYMACTNIQRDISLHFAAVCAFNCRRRGVTIFVVINQRSIAADIDIGHIPAIAATAVALHATGIQMVTTLHFNVSRDFQISITLYRTLIRSSNHIMQTTTRRRINIPISSDNYMRTIYCSLISTSIKCFK